MRLTDLSDDDLRRVADDFLCCCDTFDIPLFSWQREAFGGATQRAEGKFIHPLGAISVPRGNGKSYGAAAVGAWLFRFGPQPQDVLSVALNLEGAGVILNHARRILKGHP